MEHFLGIEGASKDPRFQFVNNPNFFQWQQLQMQQQQMQQEAQAQQQQAQQQQAQQPPEGQGGGDLSRSVDQLSGQLSKGEQQLSASRKELLIRQRKVVADLLQGFEEDAKVAADGIVKIVDQHLPLKHKE